MKKNLKLLTVCLSFSIFATTALAEKGATISSNMTFNDSNPNTCYTKEKLLGVESFKDIKPVVQYSTKDGITIEVCDNPELEIKSNISECDLEGWYYDPEFTSKVNASKLGDIMLKEVEYKTLENGCLTEVNYITTIYAKCKKVCDNSINPDKVLSYSNDGVITKRKITTKENLLTPIKEGYIFDGWYYDEAYTTKVEGNTTESIEFAPVYDEENCISSYKDVILYAKWTKIPDTCTDTINTNVNLTYVIDDTENKKVTVSTVKDEELYTPSKEGYVFAGWYYDKDFTTEVSNLTFIQKFDEKNCLIGYEDIVIYAKWEKKDETPETPKVDNPKTGDNIVLYIGVGIILLAGCIVVVKKLTNK